MIADRTCRAVSFLAARVKSRLRFAAPTGHKARRVLAHRAFRQRSQDQDQTVSDGSWPEPGLPLIERSRPPFIGLGVRQKSTHISPSTRLECYGSFRSGTAIREAVSAGNFSAIAAVRSSSIMRQLPLALLP